MSEIPTIAKIIGDMAAFKTSYWRKRPYVIHTGLDFTRLIDQKEILSDLEFGLLSPPLCTVVKNGKAYDSKSITRRRFVAGRVVHGYLDAVAVKAAINDGATCLLNHLEQWEPSLRSLADELGSSFRCRTEVDAFLSPPGPRALPAHTDGEHVLVLQVSGTKSWTVGYLDDSSLATPGLYRDGALDPELSLNIVLGPGDAMYIPHGSPHQAIAKHDTSLHLVLTMAEVTPTEIAKELVTKFAGGVESQAIDAAWARRSLTDNINSLRGALMKTLNNESVDDGEKLC